MKQLLLAGYLVMTSITGMAQSTEIIRVPAGGDLGAAISIYGLYRLPAFVQGNVYFRDGSLGKEWMNYNLLTAKMQYLSKGDTLDITDIASIAKVQMGNLIFHVVDKRWMEQLATAAPISLLVERTVGIRFERKGAFGNTDPSGSITSYNSFVAGAGTGNASYRLQVNEDAVVKKQNRYYLLGADGAAVPATRKGFFQVFPKRAEPITAYLERVKTDFGKIEDLLQLLSVATGK
ncbi:MAG TPA: hypothetical protein VL307_09915 [Chitinophagaceae bacterium]|nr:hypothetical protein [Chitinophagaceae bacterium]